MKKYDPVDRCGVVLAAGEGKRIQPFVYQLRGDTLPKQYVNFIGTRSMFEHTLNRAQMLIPRERLFTVVGLNHMEYPDVRRQLSDRPDGTVVQQPRNKETAPGLLLPLIYLYKHYPNSVVVVLPSDHFILEEGLFMDHVDSACRFVEKDPTKFVLLGVEPYGGQETEYGYILPNGEREHLSPSAFQEVIQFVEKPNLHVAQALVQRGGLWNTLVIAFKAKTLFKMFKGILPELYYSFQRILDVIGTPHEKRVLDETYQNLESINLSKDLLEVLPWRYPSCLSVLPVRGVYWSDWGTQKRLMETLREKNMEDRINNLGGVLEKKRTVEMTTGVPAEKEILEVG